MQFHYFLLQHVCLNYAKTELTSCC
uniref:Uncharacterized protein n=1 Tax=Rhizophora mucronata TaxID=61149 RepID=A0A2P2QVV1_RHIMU